MLQTKSATAGGAGRWQRSTVSNPDKYTDILSDAGHSWFHLLHKGFLRFNLHAPFVVDRM